VKKKKFSPVEDSRIEVADPGSAAYRAYRTPLLPGSPALLLFCLTLGVSAAIGAIAAQGPLLALAVVVLVLLAAAAIAWPDAPTLVVCFILYSNAAVVAIQFHGVPFIVGAAVPLLLIVPLINYLIIRRQKIIFHPVLWLMIVLLVIQMAGVIVSVKPDIALENLITYLTEGLILYFLITNVVRTPELLRRVIWALLLAGAFLGALSFHQQITKNFGKNYWGFAQVSSAAFGTGEEQIQGEVEQPRLAGPIGEQNRYAQTMLMLVPLGLFRLWGERSKWLRLLAALATGLIALGVALTFSRGAAVGFVLVIITMAFLGYIKPFQLVIVGLGLLLLLQAVPEFGTRLLKMEDLIGLLSPSEESSLAEADGSTKSRLTEMAAAGLVFADHPWVGVGPGMFKYHYLDYAKVIGLKVHQGNRQAHSLFPSIAADTGGLGLLCFTAILFVTWRDLARTRKRWLADRPELANIATGFMLAIITYLATGLFLHWGFIRFFWLIMALAGAASYLVQAETADQPT
jgi:putative inorganic carbon (HCO3(-)) transporter